jgi:hypothetical protein
VPSTAVGMVDAGSAARLSAVDGPADPCLSGVSSGMRMRRVMMAWAQRIGRCFSEWMDLSPGRMAWSATRIDSDLTYPTVCDVPLSQDLGVGTVADERFEGALQRVTNAWLLFGDSDAEQAGLVLCC